MKKIFYLTFVNLKGFTRNWKSVILLIILPLILISIIFASFNPQGLQVIKGGVINNVDSLEIGELQEYISSFMEINEFTTTEECVKDLKKYNQYLCVEVNGGNNGYVLDIYFDNTREPVIWEILQKLKTTIDILQKEKSKDIASGFISEFRETINKLDRFREELKKINSQVSLYVQTSEISVSQLEKARMDLSTTLNEMDGDIKTLKNTKYELVSTKNRLLSLNSIANPIISNKIREINEDMDDYIFIMNKKISDYESSSAKGRQHVNNINSGVNTVRNIKNDLTNYKVRIDSTDAELLSIRNKFKSIGELNPETLVNPIVIVNYPTYIPDIETSLEGETIDDIAKQFDLISLQTVFPIILFLIMVFLSLLISSFLNLTQINSPASARIGLIKRISFAEIISIYLSSLFIIAIPVLCVISLGQFLFKLLIFPNLIILFPLFFLFLSTFILFGMLISYFIKKESMTLLTTTFILVLLIFFSGFILPIERMSFFLGGIAKMMPSTLSLQAFNQVVFYEANIPMISHYLNYLFIYCIVLFVLVCLTKKIRN
jgi:ABC-type multidrug transport system permease subunit